MLVISLVNTTMNGHIDIDIQMSLGQNDTTDQKSIV